MGRCSRARFRTRLTEPPGHTAMRQSMLAKDETWRVLPALISTFLLALACGALPDEGTAASSARTTASPQIDTSSWKSYSSAKWGYTFRYPSQWYELGTLGAPATEEYLSNERVGSPISLSPTGVFVAVSIHNSSSNSDCSLHGVPTTPTAIDRMGSVSIDGTSSNLYAIAGGEPYFQLNTMRGDYCYMFSFVFRTASLRDSTEPIVRALIATFRFGSPGAPAP